jgi:hypothetical protein
MITVTCDIRQGKFQIDALIIPKPHQDASLGMRVFYVNLKCGNIPAFTFLELHVSALR